MNQTMTTKQLLESWQRQCLKKGHNPIALVCVDEEGYPIILSHNEPKVLQKVWQHLATVKILSESDI
jgi:hypothetical protein